MSYNPADSQVSLQLAVRTLRAIRQRYETGRNVDSGYGRSYTVQVALDYTDMLWVTAAIESLEKAITVGKTEIARCASPARPET